MKHARRTALALLLALVTLFSLSAPAWAVFRFPAKLREIGDEAFAGVPLPGVTYLQSGIEKIGANAFAGSRTRMFWIPATVREMADDALDAGVPFVCSPNTYADQWGEAHGWDYDYIKPFLSSNKTSLVYGDTVTLTANPYYMKEPTGYIWEARGRERDWSLIPDETGPVLRFIGDQRSGYLYFRVSCVWGDMVSEPSDALCVSCYDNELRFLEDRCKALSGDSVYLEWGYLGNDINYILMQWFPEPDNPAGGGWYRVDTFTGGWNRTVYGLDPNTEYDFKLIVQDQDPTIDDDEQELFTTIRITTPEPPTSVQMKDFREEGRSVHLSWEPISNAVYDVYLGNDPDNLSFYTGNLSSTEYHIYGFAPGQKRYLRVRAKIPNSGYFFWGPTMEYNATDAGPYLSLESCAVKGDTASLSWKELPGCVYDVYLIEEGGVEALVTQGSSLNYVDIGGLQDAEKWIVRVQARWGSWTSNAAEIEVVPEALNDVEYRALMIGQASFKGTMYSPRNYKDVLLMADMLEKVKTPDGTHYSVIRRKDLNREQILGAIQEAFSSADENDVSLLFISTHGDVNLVGREAGSLSTVEVPYQVYGDLLMQELADALNRIKGTKIVWLGSCGSGAAIYDTEEENYTENPYEFNEEEWEGWRDDTVNPDNDLFYSDAAAYDIRELRLPGFQVMTAARYRYVSWGSEALGYTFFTKFLCDGVLGPDGSMPADLNGDGLLTQHELFLYVKLREEDPETGADQNVQAYPFASDYVLFKK